MCHKVEGLHISQSGNALLHNIISGDFNCSDSKNKLKTDYYLY